MRVIKWTNWQGKQQSYTMPDYVPIVPVKGSGCAVKCCGWSNTRLEREYKSEISTRLKLLGSLRWGRLRALVIGWAIAKGQDPDEAKRFATHIQYH